MAGVFPRFPNSWGGCPGRDVTLGACCLPATRWQAIDGIEGRSDVASSTTPEDRWAGNSTTELICLVGLANGEWM